MADYSIPPPIQWTLVGIYTDKWDESKLTKPGRITAEEYDRTISVPSVTIPNVTEAAEGETGYFAMSNSGPVQKFRGEAQVHIWTTEDELRERKPDANVITWIDQAAKELGRITRQHVTSLNGYRDVGWASVRDQHEKDRTPVIYHKIGSVTFSYKVR